MTQKRHPKRVTSSEKDLKRKKTRKNEIKTKKNEKTKKNGEKRKKYFGNILKYFQTVLNRFKLERTGPTLLVVHETTSRQTKKIGKKSRTVSIVSPKWPRLFTLKAA